MNFSWRTCLILLLINISCLKFCSGQKLQDDISIKKLENIFKNFSPSSFKDGENKENFSSPCDRDYNYFLKDFEERQSWTLQMIDATSKIPSGILTGNIFDLGMFDECLSIKVKKFDTEIRGKHCIYSFKLKYGNLTSAEPGLFPKLSICVPASCNHENVSQFLKSFLPNHTSLGNLELLDISTTCSSIDPKEWSTADILVSSLLGIYLIFLLSCTALDILQDKMDIQQGVVNSLSLFSMRKSALQIFNMKANPKSFPALNGIRVLSIFWIVLGHEYLFKFSTFLNVNNLEILDWVQSWKSLHIFIAPFAVDTFFTLSGFLMSYMFIKEMSSGRKFNIFEYYLHRYIRLTPAVMALLLVSIFITPHLGFGPVWETSVDNFLCKECKEMWWPYLLYIQNYVKKDNPCLKHLWYLAVDMQLFWLSPIILYPLSRKPKIGFLIFGLLSTIALIIPAVAIAVNEYPLTLFEGGTRMNGGQNSFNDFYAVTHTRAGSWLVGVLLGYLVAMKKIKLNKMQIITGWVAAILCFAFCDISFRNLKRNDHVYDVVWESILGSICRPIWAAGVAWIILASIVANGDPVSKFLSLPIFLPLSRISYCIYLVHMVIQQLRIGALKTPIYFSDFAVVSDALSNLALTIVASFFFSLFFESPILVLEKMVFRRKTRIEKIEEVETNLGKEHRISTISVTYNYVKEKNVRDSS